MSNNLSNLHFKLNLLSLRSTYTQHTVGKKNEFPSNVNEWLTNDTRILFHI